MLKLNICVYGVCTYECTLYEHLTPKHIRKFPDTYLSPSLGQSDLMPSVYNYLEYTSALLEKYQLKYIFMQFIQYLKIENGIPRASTLLIKSHHHSP